MTLNVSKVILVDQEDHQVGLGSKSDVHRLGLLHRAYSIFILREKREGLELLLQQRALHKYHSGGLWTNTCCSHPEPGVDMIVHAKKRLYEEVGLETPLEKVGVFQYCSELPNGLVENEIDHVFIGYVDSNAVLFNKEEIMAVKWVALKEVQSDLERHPNLYTAWFGQALSLVYHYLYS